MWRAEGVAEPNTGRRLRGLFQEAGFSRVEASAHFICYGTPDRIIAFAYDRAAECRNLRLQATVARHGIAPVEELTQCGRHCCSSALGCSLASTPRRFSRSQSARCRVASAIFLILELDAPYSGILRLPPAPILQAIDALGK